ncbi:hypothetical protein ACRS52_20255 [Bacillus cytotoxicus]|uniref:Cell wall-binding protein n=1 Tax=Bacillus cytotoxicus TaxID=580165 RepID=A0AAX2CEK2_9BACI|nr:hypothetical protein [Bacillus cytotoxicus]QTR82956.1 hypothetical protein JC777_21200 [Bacillus cytotoxicus]QTR86694.1 hypothetical protein JC774_19705 [Bacillus cytotoxicus]SCL87392.1 Uncharacterized protein BCB44BAC_01118 [Bacillus cytotoxicus]
MKIVKSKKLWVTLALIFGLVISYSIGARGAKVAIEKEKVTYEEAKAKVEEKEKELSYTKSKIKEGIDAEQKKLDDKKDEVKETLALVDNKNQLASEVDKLGKDVEAKKSEVTELDVNIQAKKSELQKLTEGVKAKQEEPRVLGAGEYIVGKDIPSGRYKATAVGRGSNFIIFDGNRGTAKVNTILGNSSVGRGDYTFFTSDGDIIKAAEQVKLIPRIVLKK